METYLWNNGQVVAECLEDGKYKITEKIFGSICYTEDWEAALTLGNFLALGQTAYYAN